MKKLLVFCAIFSTFLCTSVGFPSEKHSIRPVNPKFALGDRVVLVNPGFYRNCTFPAFIEGYSEPDQYDISFYCPSQWGDKQLVHRTVNEKEIELQKVTILPVK